MLSRICKANGAGSQQGRRSREGAARVTPQCHDGTQSPISPPRVHPLPSSLWGQVSPGTPSGHSSSRSLQAGDGICGTTPLSRAGIRTGEPEQEPPGLSPAPLPRAGGAKPSTQFGSSARASPSLLAADGHGLQRQEPGAAPGRFLQPDSRSATPERLRGPGRATGTPWDSSGPAAGTAGARDKGTAGSREAAERGDS